MTPEERRTRLAVGMEIIEDVIVDFLENSDDDYNSYEIYEELDEILPYETCNDMLKRLLSQDRIANRTPTSYNRWQAL